MTQASDVQAWLAGGPRPAWVAAGANPTWVANELRNFGMAAVLSAPQLTDNKWWTNTASPHAAASRTDAQTQLVAYLQGGATPAWFGDLPKDQQDQLNMTRSQYAATTITPANQATYTNYVAQIASGFLSSGVNSSVYVGGNQYQAAQAGQVGKDAPHAAPGQTTTDSGEQPVGEGFGTDNGLAQIIAAGDPNFAFGSGQENINFNPQTNPAKAVGSNAVFPGNTGAAQPVGSDAVFGAPNPVNPNTLTRPGSTLNPQPPAPVSTANQQRFSGTQPITTSGTPTTGIATTGSGTGTTGVAQAKAVGSTGAFTGTAGVTTTPGTLTTATGTTDQKNALADLQAVLNQYGLGSLTTWAWTQIQQGASEAQVLLNIRDTPEFKARFPAIAQRQQAGLPPISPADYVNYENQATQMMRAAGLPSGFWDSPSDFTTLLSNDVSLNELSQRVGMAQQAAYQVPADVRATLQRDYGIGSGQLAAFFLDPKTAEPLLARDFTSAQIGGAAYRTGYGSTRTEDERLTDLGVTAPQAQQGFSQLTAQRQLFSTLPGENTTGITRDQQLAAAFSGNTLDQEAILRRSQTRAATFAGGGGFNTSQAGFGGIGEANSV